MSANALQQLDALSVYLASRREVILDRWREAADADPEQTTVASLTRAQFNDHIPQVLDAFERKLRARPGGDSAAAADEDRDQEDVKHGLHRWQQGYLLRELMHEWGHLHRCIFEEVEEYGRTHPEVERETLAAANRELIQLVSAAISESTGQYARLQQDEAAGHARDLERALANLNGLERQRGELIRQAVHDLGGNVQTVSTAAALLGYSDLHEAERTEYTSLLQTSAGALRDMLRDLMDLARLEAGQDSREITSFNAASVLRDLRTVTEPMARARGLDFHIDGPDSLLVEGDPSKVRRIGQNLVLNAIKYTERGSVAVSWGEEGAGSWWLMVKDTGPGLMAGPGAPIVAGLKEATASARESDEIAAEEVGDDATVLTPPPGDTDVSRYPVRQQSGEGIGLSIVKRLCELLDASLELASSPESGTTFRVVLPRSYPETVEAAAGKS